MEPLRKKKKLRKTSEYQGEDRISALPDELIHQILKFVNTKLGIRTSVLSKRWKLIWTTLPFLEFKWDRQGSSKNITNLTRHVLNHRNHRSRVSCLELAYLPPGLIDKFVKYAISGHVENLVVHLRDKHRPYKLSNFSSNSIRSLELRMKLRDFVSEADCWDLPALTTLHLWHMHTGNVYQFLPVRCLTCLPALRTLRLTFWDFRESALYLSLPELTTLDLSMCYLPKKVWNLPALKTLTLYDVDFSGKMSDVLAALVSLQNLTLDCLDMSMQDCVIPCPQLINLEIKTCYDDTFKGSIVVLAPKLSNFTSVGIFPITFGASNLENVYLKLRGSIEYTFFSLDKSKRYYQQFKTMLPGLASARILNLELETIEALSSISDYLASSPSPFCNLKYVKLPYRCKEASICSTLRSYLIGASPTATFVTTMPQNMIPQTAASVTAPNVLIKETLAAPTKLFVYSENMRKTVCGNTVDLVVQEEHAVQNSEVHADRVIHVGTPSEVTCNAQVGSSRGNSNSGLWQGHEVNSEFVCLLNQILNKYPETFENLTTKNKFSTMKINMLCTAINDFTKIPMTEVNTKMINEYRDVFSDLQKLGFNVSWLVNRLNYIKQLQISQPLLLELHAIDCHIDDAKCKLQHLQIRIDESKIVLLDLQTLRAEKMQEIQKALGTMDTSVAVGCVGENLFSCP